MWNREIDLTLKIIGGVRIGIGQGSSEVDLPLNTLSSAYTSALKGLIRKAFKKVERIRPDWKVYENSLLGGPENQEGKLKFKIVKESIEKVKKKKTIRVGIRMDDRLGSVTPQSLFSYEIASEKEPHFELKFKMIPLLPLSESEVVALYGALNLLRYESIGGFGSRGLGIIEEVMMNEEFVRIAKTKLEVEKR